MSLGTDAEVGEAWIQQHARTFADGFATKGIAASDYFILPRHAWIGSWRYSAALWSGDIVSTFDELAIQVKVLQGVMMSGVSLWTTDIGGCKDRPHPHTHKSPHPRATSLRIASATRCGKPVADSCALSRLPCKTTGVIPQTRLSRSLSCGGFSSGHSARSSGSTAIATDPTTRQTSVVAPTARTKSGTLPRTRCVALA
jgi:hypothetical protein